MLTRIICPKCGHVGAATAASLLRVLICSQCGQGAFIKERRTGELAERCTRRTGGPARGYKLKRDVRATPAKSAVNSAAEVGVQELTATPDKTSLGSFATSTNS
jgi:DNA-directed RNA polymerase subunit RPC12/RpoP